MQAEAVAAITTACVVWLAATPFDVKVHMVKRVLICIYSTCTIYRRTVCGAIDCSGGLSTPAMVRHISGELHDSS